MIIISYPIEDVGSGRVEREWLKDNPIAQPGAWIIEYMDPVFGFWWNLYSYGRAAEILDGK